MKVSIFHRVENIVGNGEMLVTSIFSFSRNVIKTLLCRIVKSRDLLLKSQQRPTRKVFVYKIQVNAIYTILKYGDYYDFMDR